jgi:hypothetical protein
MPPSEAQVRALETLGRHYVSDPGILQLLTELYAQTPSAPVQAAIAGHAAACRPARDVGARSCCTRCATQRRPPPTAKT